MKNTLAGASLVLLILAGPIRAQQQSPSSWTEHRPVQTLFTIGWEMAEPIGSFHNYIDKFSFSGFTFDWRSFLKDDLSAGLRFTWNRFSQTFSHLVVTTPSGGTLSGPTYRFASQFAVEAVGHFYAGKDALVPYGGLGIGGVWSNSYQQVVDLAVSNNGFHFILTPEVGVLYRLARGQSTAGLTAAVRYHFTTQSFANVSNAMSLAFVLGGTFAY